MDPINVVSLDEYRAHIAGQAKCMNCKNTWAAVAPVGTVQFECPLCNLMTGAWNSQIQSGATGVWQCKCDNDLFTLPEGGVPMCARCGLYARAWVDGTRVK